MEYRQIIKEYYRCFKDADKEGLRKILPPDFKHISEHAIYSDRDKMIEEIRNPNYGRKDAEFFINDILENVPYLTVQIAHLGGAGFFSSTPKA